MCAHPAYTIDRPSTHGRQGACHTHAQGAPPLSLNPCAENHDRTHAHLRIDPSSAARRASLELLRSQHHRDVHCHAMPKSAIRSLYSAMLTWCLALCFAWGSLVRLLPMGTQHTSIACMFAASALSKALQATARSWTDMTTSLRRCASFGLPRSTRCERVTTCARRLSALGE